MAKHTAETPARRLRWPALLLIGAALLSLTIGSAVAYLSAATGGVANSFLAASQPALSITETFNNETKTNVSVNVGDPGYAVYVRAAVVITWKNGTDGDVLGTAPVQSTDYTISYNETDWFRGSDGFWYCKTAVTSGNTPVLINACEPAAAAPETGYTLNVEIVAQTIQALGGTDADDTPAVEDAWKAVVVGANGILEAKPTT